MNTTYALCLSRWSSIVLVVYRVGRLSRWSSIALVVYRVGRLSRWSSIALVVYRVGRLSRRSSIASVVYRVGRLSRWSSIEFAYIGTSLFIYHVRLIGMGQIVRGSPMTHLTLLLTDD
jgi:hypothetical protein